MKKILLISTLAGMFLCGVNAIVATQPQNKFQNFIGKVKQSAVGQVIGQTLQNTQTGRAISQLVGQHLGRLVQSTMPTVNQTVMNINTALSQVEMEINQAYTMQMNAGQTTAAQAKAQCDQQIQNIRANLNGLQTSLTQNISQVPSYMANVVNGCNQLQSTVRSSFPTVNTQTLTTYANNLRVAQALNQNIEGAISQCQTLRSNYDAKIAQNINSMSNQADQSAALAAKQAVDNDFDNLIQNFQIMRQNIMMSQMLDINSFNQTRNNIQTSISDLKMRLGNDVNFSGSVTQLSNLSQVVLNSTATGLDQAVANKINNYSTNTMPVNTTSQQTYNQSYNTMPVSTVPQQTYNSYTPAGVSTTGTIATGRRRG